MSTDLVGFSRPMGADEARTLRLLDIHHQIIHQVVTAHHGTVSKPVGDASLGDFPSVVPAVQRAQHLHGQFQSSTAATEQSGQLPVRLGIHRGPLGATSVVGPMR